MEDLRQGDRVMTTDTEKAEALSSMFFPDLPVMEVDDQRAIVVMCVPFGRPASRWQRPGRHNWL